MTPNELPSDPVAPSTTSTVDDYLRISWNSIEIVLYGVFGNELTADVTNIALMNLSNIEKKEILSSVETSFKLLRRDLRNY